MNRTKKTGFALIGLLVALIILSFLYLIAMKKFFPEGQKDNIDRSLAREGIDSSNSKALIESTREKIDDINQNFKEQQKRIDSIEY